MRNYFAGITLALLLHCANTNAQTTDVLRNQLDNIFQNINKSQVPFGYFFPLCGIVIFIIKL